MAKVHLMLQAKGGLGKSYATSLIAQWARDRAGADEARAPVCIDTDPTTPTFSKYAALGVKHIQIMEGPDINPIKFDVMTSAIMNQGPDARVVIDTGGNVFISLVSYMLSCDVFELLASAGHEIFIHAIVVGGDQMGHSITGLDSMLRQFPPVCQFVIWLNEHYGPVENEGRPFERSAMFEKNKERIGALIRLPNRNKALFGNDVIQMTAAHLTFAEVVADSSWSVMTRQRLTIVRDDVYRQLDEARVL